MQRFKQHIVEDTVLSEGELKITNGHITKMFKPLDKEIKRLRNSKHKIDNEDADRLEYGFKPALNARNIKTIAQAMARGDTEYREKVFKIVSSVIGREQAQLLAQAV